jgi:hypothetical protein
VAIINGSNVWVNGFVAPDDGDGRDAASVVVGLGALGDRTVWLKTHSPDWLAGGTFANGSVTLTGPVIFHNLTVGNGSWPKLAGTRTTTRNSWRLAATNFAGTLFTSDVPESKVVLANSGNGTTRPVMITRSINSLEAGKVSIVEITGLPIGWNLTSIAVVAQGSGDTSAAGTGSYRLIRWKGSNVAENLGGVSPDAHIAGNWTTVTTQTVNPTSPALIEAGWQYGLRITHSYSTGLGAGSMTFWDFTANLSGEVIKL